MTRYHGNQQAKAGFYVNLDSWHVATLSGEGGQLPGDAQTTYRRMPLPVLLVAAPLMGAAFAIFLPFIGLALVGEHLVKRAWGATREAAHASAMAVGPRTRTGEAFFTGSADGKEKAAADAKTEERIKQLEQAVENRERRE